MDSQYIKSKLNGLYIDLPNQDTANGTQMQMYTFNETSAQKLKLDLISAKQQTIEKGVYNIISKKDTSKVIEIKNANDTIVQLNTKGSNGCVKCSNYFSW